MTVLECMNFIEVIFNAEFNLSFKTPFICDKCNKLMLAETEITGEKNDVGNKYLKQFQRQIIDYPSKQT